MWAALAALAGGIAVLSLFTKSLSEPTQLLSDGTVSADGTTPADPKGLAKGAGLSLPAYCLARMAVSEAGNLPPEAQLGVIWATKNHCAAVGISIPGVLLHTNGVGRGYFGSEEKQTGRFAATSQDSTATSRALANGVLAAPDSVPDPTGGAQQWDSPRSFSDWDGTSSAKANAVAAARIAAGNTKVLLPGIPESHIRFWKPVTA